MHLPLSRTAQLFFPVVATGDALTGALDGSSVRGVQDVSIPAAATTRQAGNERSGSNDRGMGGEALCRVMRLHIDLSPAPRKTIRISPKAPLGNVEPLKYGSPAYRYLT